MTRILILTGIFPPDIGGPATQLDYLAKELIKNNYHVRILTFGSSDKKYDYPVRRISRFWPGFLKGLIYLISGLFYAVNADIVYNQDLYTSGLTGLAIKRILKKKLITRFVENPVWETGSFSQTRKNILFGSDKIIVVSNFVKNMTLDIGLPEEKIKVIYNSVDFLDTDSLGGKEELKKKLGLKGITLLSIGRLTPFKGMDMLIELMPDLIKRYGEINLFIVGQGKEFNNLRRLVASLDLEKRVFLKGKLGRQETTEYLKAADIFLLNTHHEGMSHTLLEAMKIGTPVITTNRGGNPETIQDNQTGVLVDYNDKKAWLRAVINLLDNQGLRKKLTRAAQRDLTRFSWNNLIKETIKVFEEVKRNSLNA